MLKKSFLFSVYTIIIINYLQICNAKISDKRLCADPECSSILSYATTLLRYFPSEECMIQFPSNVKVNIHSKGAGERKDLWEISYNGKRGYAPSRLLKETKILKKQSELIYEVATQCGNENKLKVPPSDPTIEEPVPTPASATEQFDMIDGTKIFSADVADNIEEINETGSGENVLATPSLSPSQQIPEEVTKLPEEVINEDSVEDYEEGEQIESSEIDDKEDEIDLDEEPPVDESTTIRNAESVEQTENKSSENISEPTINQNVENEILLSDGNSDHKTETFSEIILDPMAVIVDVPSKSEEIKNESEPEHVTTSTLPTETIDPTVPDLLENENVSEASSTNQYEMLLENLSVTENPNEIPLPILDNKINFETTTATPMIESFQKEPVPESSKSELEKLPNDEEMASDTLPVPSVEEQNQKTELENENTVHEPVKLDNIEEIKDAGKSEPSSVQEPLEENNQRIGLENENTVNEPVKLDNIEEIMNADKSESATVQEQEIIPDVNERNSEEIVQPYETVTKPQETPQMPELNHYPPPPLPTVSQDIPNVFEEPDPFIKQQEGQNPELNSNLPLVQPENNDILPKVENINEQNQEPIEEEIKSSENSNQITDPAVSQPDPPYDSNEILSINNSQEPDSLPPSAQMPSVPVPSDVESEPRSGFFAGIYGKIFGSSNGNELPQPNNNENIPLDEELERILYPEKFRNAPESSPPKSTNDESTNEPVPDGYCENVSPNSCPQSIPTAHSTIIEPFVSQFNKDHTDEPKYCTQVSGIDYEGYIRDFLDGILKLKVFIVYLTITSATVLVFMLGHYCLGKNRKESPLINKLNILERNLMVSKKENALLQGEHDDIRQKLASIEDNSFGSNEMVIALKTQLEESENQRNEYEVQIATLEKEVESATEAGLELNRMVAELLSNQSGSDSIISTVEELQKQLNEQQETILSINATLAEKSRENSELQVYLNEQKAQFEDDLGLLQSLNDDLTESNKEMSKKITEMNENHEITVNNALKLKSDEIVKLHKDLGVLKNRYEDSQRKLAKAEARCQVVDEYLKNAKKDSSSTDAKEIFDLVQLKSDVLAANKEREQFKERLENEIDARRSLEDHLKVVSDEVSNLKKEYNVAEKEKVEAQTRLEVLSGYFKEKETQLQKELSIKEAMWLQQQGEKTSTIERVQSMQDDIQNLKSQNDALRAEIEAQAAAHKTQIATLDSRAHEEWLNAKQAKRKLEELRVEAAGLRRKLTTYGESGGTGIIDSGIINGDMNAPSPIHMGDTNPGSSMMGVLPPPPFIPPFMGPPPPFMPPPFMPGEMRPPPLGRLMSPPPNRYSPSILDDRDHYSPNRSPGRYSPEARYNYNDALSPYETETDFSPPPSPPPPRHGYRDNRGYKAYSPPPSQLDSRNKKSKGGLSSGSTDSLPRRRGGGGGGEGGDSAAPNNLHNSSSKV